MTEFLSWTSRLCSQTSDKQKDKTNTKSIKSTFSHTFCVFVPRWGEAGSFSHVWFSQSFSQIPDLVLWDVSDVDCTHSLISHFLLQKQTTETLTPLSLSDYCRWFPVYHIKSHVERWVGIDSLISLEVVSKCLSYIMMFEKGKRVMICRVMQK